MITNMVLNHKRSYFVLAFMLSSFIISDTVPFGGFCSFHEQCTGSNISGVCENGRCACTKGFTFTDLACEKSNDMQNLKKKNVCARV